MHYRQKRYWRKEDELGTVQQHRQHGTGSTSLKGYARYGHEEVHRLRAVKVLGKPLPPGAVVHHFDLDKDNPEAVLIICPSQEYHALLHTRQEALEVCGNPNARKCRYCHEWDDPVVGNMYLSYGSNHHRACRNEVGRNSRKGVL